MKNTPYEDILVNKRGTVATWPKNKKAVMIVSGGLDSIVTAARLMEEFDLTLFPLHIERGQTNYMAERNSLDYFTKDFQTKYPGQFNDVKYIKLNVPPTEIKQDLLDYTKKNGHPLRDTMLQMAAVQYAASLGQDVKAIFCAVMPEDYFPHSNIESIRATNIAVCQNMADWEWIISSPNIDTHLIAEPTSKKDEIIWAKEHGVAAGKTVSCNVATSDTDLKNCGTCSSCERRKEAFALAGVDDDTEYYQ